MLQFPFLVKIFRFFSKPTNKAAIEEITDFGMILDHIICLLSVKSKDANAEVNIHPCAVEVRNYTFNGSTILVRLQIRKPSLT